MLNIRNATLSVLGLFALAACNSTTTGVDLGTGGNAAPQVTKVLINGSEPVAGSWIAPEVSLYIRAKSDRPLTELNYQVSGDLNRTVANPQADNLFTETLSGGKDKTLSVTVKDTNGKTSAAYTVKVNVDATAPVINVSVPDTSTDIAQEVRGTVTFKFSAVDAESGVRDVKLYKKGATSDVLSGVTSDGQGNYTANVDTTRYEDGVNYFEVQSTNKAGLQSTRTFKVNVHNTNTPPAPQPPAVSLFLTPGEKAGQINIPARADSEDGIKFIQLLIDNTPNFTINNPEPNKNVLFSLDTTQLSNGTHRIRVKARTNQNVDGSSEEILINVTNLVVPLFSISSPAKGTSLSVAESVKIAVVRRTTDFAFTSDLTVEVKDYGGNVVSRYVINKNLLANNGDGTYSTPLIDWPRLTGSDRYVVLAYADVVLDPGKPTEVPVHLEDLSEVQVDLSNLRPPAATIRMPVRNNDAAIKPVLHRSSGLVVMATDEKGLKRVDVRLINESIGVNKYLLNIPLLTGSTLNFDYVIPSLELDGSVYVADKTDYTLRMTVEDNDGNVNIQEIPVTVDRTKNTIANTVYNSNHLNDVVLPDIYFAGKPDKESALWVMCQTPTDPQYALLIHQASKAGPKICPGLQVVNPSRLMVVTSVSGSIVETKTYADLPAGSALPAVRVLFSGAGSYRVDFVLQDLVTGVETYFQGDSVQVAVLQ